MKASTVLLLLVVFVCVAQATTVVEAAHVQDWFSDIFKSIGNAIQSAYNFVNAKIYYYSSVVGIEVVCRAGAAIQFKQYDQTYMVQICKDAAYDQISVNSAFHH
jgi:Flp pilus assembly pilin Flp